MKKCMVFFCLILAVSFVLPLNLMAGVPAAAKKYRRLLVRSTNLHWGLDGPVADLGGQDHAESGWNAEAVSWAGASGLSQFMPATAKWWSKKKGLGAPEPTNPSWALQAQVSYMHWLYGRARASDPCNKMGLALGSYNGGETWTKRDAKKAKSLGLDPENYHDLGKVNAGRSESAKRENREYPIKILERYSPIYQKAGWGESQCSKKF